MENTINSLKVYMAYFKIKFLNEIQYKVAAIAGALTQFAWGFMYIMLYTAFLKEGTSDYSISQMSTYIWLNQAFFALFNMWSIDKEILEQCRIGTVSMELVKPISLYNIWHSRTLGSKAAKALLRSIPILLICSMPFFGIYKISLPASLSAFIFSIITLVLSVGITLAYCMLMYIAVMKTVSSQGIRTAFDLVYDFCSGGLFPIPFMPNNVIKVLKFTPFYYTQNVSSNIYNGYISGNREIIKIIIIQVVWLVLMTWIGKRIMKRQIRKIEVNGG